MTLKVFNLFSIFLSQRQSAFHQLTSATFSCQNSVCTWCSFAFEISYVSAFLPEKVDDCQIVQECEQNNLLDFSTKWNRLIQENCHNIDESLRKMISFLQQYPIYDTHNQSTKNSTDQNCKPGFFLKWNHQIFPFRI